MQSSNENAIYNAVKNLCSNLMSSQSQLSAYPHLQPLFVNLGAGLDNIFVNMLVAQREELLYGKSPWAMLYKLQVGKDIKLPENILSNLAASDNHYSTINYPIYDILAYALVQRPELKDQVELVFEDDDKIVTIDLKKGRAFIKWHENDMVLTFPTLGRSTAMVTCPLFAEPYMVDVKIEYVQEQLTGPLYKMLTGVNPSKPSAAKYILMEYFFNDADVAKEGVPDDHPVTQLIHLFRESGYDVPIYVDIPYKDYIVRLRATTDWDSIVTWNNSILVIDQIWHADSEDNKPYRDWHLNPLFVNDLLAESLDLIKGVVEKGLK